MYSLFRHANIANMKILFEGGGKQVEPKFAHPFQGFKDAFTLITCNYLVCPFVAPVSSNSGYNHQQYESDKYAMDGRTTVVNFNKKFVNTGFLFGETEWA